MISRLGHVVAAVVASATLPRLVGAFFVVPSATTVLTIGNEARRRTAQQQRRISLDPDWDNATFLSSLGGSPDDMDDANEKYYRQRDLRAAMDAWRTRNMAGLHQQPKQQLSSPLHLAEQHKIQAQQFYDANGNTISEGGYCGGDSGGGATSNGAISYSEKSVTSSPPTKMTNDPLAGSVACIEAVLKMFKEASDPVERDAMVALLHAALNAAISISNRYIAESKLGPPPSRSIMGFPTLYTSIDPTEKEVEGAISMPAAMTTSDGWTANDKKLQDLYSALLNVRGDEAKLGLRNISGKEANDLANKLVAMRGVLLYELNNCA